MAALNIAAILLAHHAPEQCEWAWQFLGYGEKRYGRHRGAVAQQMINRFMPAAMQATPPAQITVLKAQGQQLDGETIYSTLLAALA
ncbi:MAG: hypothetical protein HC804_13435 [Anaerolineae bacterium]|nr:hypothetical protein [Anaerolineae bacterium]